MFKKALLMQAALLSTAAGVGAQDYAADMTDGHVETVVVSAQRNFRPGALKADIVKTEVLTVKQIENVNAFNINEALDNNPGIAVQVECSICNVRNVTLNNLPGRFTTLMIDGVPLFSSLSSAYGLDSVNVRGIEQVEVARGAGASLIAPEALAGAVNIVTKKPDGYEMEADVGAGEHNLQTVSVYAGGKLDEHFSAALTASYNKQSSNDANGNLVSEFTGHTRYMGGIALFGDFGDVHAKLRLDFIDEKRGGGPLGGDYTAHKTNASGNPFDWSGGKHGSASSEGWYAPDGSGFVTWDDGTAGLTEVIFTKRASALGTVDGKFSAKLDWRIAYGYARNNQHSFYEGTVYNANGNQAYSEATLHYRSGTMVVSIGGNYRYEDLDSISIAPNSDPVDGLDSYVYRTPGAFAEYYDVFFGERLEVNASVRYDDNNVFGGIWSPRLNLLWHHTPNLSSRLSLGRGYRAPTSFFEQDHGILDTSSIVREIDDPETSENLSYALNYSDDRLSATLSYNFNQISHFALLEVEGSIVSHEGGMTLFTQADHAVTIQGFDGTVSYQLLPSLMLSAGGEHFFYSFDPGTLAFSRPDWKIFFSADWDYGDLDVYGRVSITGPSDLKKFYDYAGEQRYNFDGTRKLDESPVFATVDVKASYAVSGNWSVYLGVNNLFDYTQTDVEDPLWINRAGEIDVAHIWGPMLGRMVYGGIKYAL